MQLWDFSMRVELSVEPSVLVTITNENQNYILYYAFFSYDVKCYNPVCWSARLMLACFHFVLIWLINNWIQHILGSFNKLCVDKAHTKNFSPVA